ncbi:pentatricopeptide repeat-containing protein 2, mitochondrial-like [Galleria mellonella]|uniref:Pentatricopeptide repeat-containing protein 2, mitochondrial-like n=1 Tax=Galleria mellonella TaxID=7137 RepID=A0A6J1X1A4_GALME|nr:pentatricopeptide repeat-containing protein 2, mitochondrial-like [Galleria mellonella]
MSLFINSILRSAGHNNFRIFNLCRLFHVTQVDQLYSPAALGIDGYLQTRRRIKDQFENFSDKFRTKMNGFISDPKSMIFTEDLKNMVHMAEPFDLELLLNMIKKFNSQSSEFRFGSFIFGPVVMRMFHFLDAPKEALKCFEDPINKGFFDQLISYHILLDLLYNHEMYDEMYRVFEVVKEKQINMTKFPKYPVTLILAACYKQNTPQSLEYASKLWSEMTKMGTAPLRRACTFFAGLALKQGAPHIALESISTQKQHYVTIRNIKAMALADMGRLEDALPVLRTVLDIDIPEEKDKHTFFEETITKVRNAVEKSSNKDIRKEFDDIVTALNDRRLIDNQTLEQLLNTEITVKKQRDAPPFQQKRLPFQQRHKKRNNNLA